QKSVLIKDGMRTREGRRKVLLELGFSPLESDPNNTSVEVASNLELPAAKSPYRLLKDYQFEVYFQALEKIAHPYSRFILQMPTGSGKTRTAMEVVCDHLNSGEDASVVWL